MHDKDMRKILLESCWAQSALHYESENWMRLTQQILRIRHFYLSLGTAWVLRIVILVEKWDRNPKNSNLTPKQFRVSEKYEK